MSFFLTQTFLKKLHKRTTILLTVPCVPCVHCVPLFPLSPVSPCVPCASCVPCVPCVPLCPLCPLVSLVSPVSPYVPCVPLCPMSPLCRLCLLCPLHPLCPLCLLCPLCIARNLGHLISWDLHSVCHAMDNSAGFLRVSGSYWVATFRFVCGPTEAADWLYCLKNWRQQTVRERSFSTSGFGGNDTAKLLRFSWELLGLFCLF